MICDVLYLHGNAEKSLYGSKLGNRFILIRVETLRA